MTPGYQALTRAAAVIDLSGRARIRATGEDRARLLHALTTNHIQQLLPGHGCYTFFLNAQGRVLADANIFVFAEHLLIDTEPELRQLLWDHLDHYIIADDVTLHDDTEATFCLGVEGPQANKRLCELDAPAPANDFAHEAWGDLTVARATFTGGPGYRVFGPAEQKTLLLDRLYLAEATLQDAEVARIEHARPQYGKDITIARLSAETGQTHALHLQKGCYLGQEIVERVRSRGHVNRRLVGIEFDGTAVPPLDSKVLVDGKEVGEITSAAYSPHAGKVMALGYVRVLNDHPGTRLEAGGIHGSIRSA